MVVTFLASTTQAPAFVSADRHATYGAIQLREGSEDTKMTDVDVLRPILVADGGVETVVGGLFGFLQDANVQIEKDIVNRQSGRANPHWHFEHDPSQAPEMAPLLERLKKAGIDYTYGPTLHPGRIEAIEKMRIRPGTHVLEVGVGTCINLGMYPRNARITIVFSSNAL